MITAQHTTHPPHLLDTVFRKIRTKIGKILSILLENIPLYTVRLKNLTQTLKSSQDNAKLIRA